MAINTAPAPLELVDMDTLPFPLLISNCLGLWPGATTEKLPCLLLFYMHAFHKVIITSWRAEGLNLTLAIDLLLGSHLYIFTTAN